LEVVDELRLRAGERPPAFDVRCGFAVDEAEDAEDVEDVEDAEEAEDVEE